VDIQHGRRIRIGDREMEPVDLALPLHGVSADQVAAARSGQKDA